MINAVLKLRAQQFAVIDAGPIAADLEIAVATTAQSAQGSGKTVVELLFSSRLAPWVKAGLADEGGGDDSSKPSDGDGAGDAAEADGDGGDAKQSD